MRFHFSATSNLQLSTVEPALAVIIQASLDKSIIDFAVLQGRRSKEQQEIFFQTGRSKLQWPNSKHNVQNPTDLARAVDVAPFINGRVTWQPEQFIFLAGIVLATAREFGVSIRWGGNWDMDGEILTDQTFNDLGHFELV